MKNERWELTEHCCAGCQGRVLRRVARGQEILRCADCGIAGQDDVRAICMCGTKLNNGKLLGLKCLPNPALSAVSPFEIIAAEV
jgi:hypothetical protein